MRLLLLTFVSFFALAFAIDDTPVEIYGVVRSVNKALHQQVRLAEALGEEDNTEELDEVEHDLRTGFLEIVKQTLNDVYQRIQNAIKENKFIVDLVRQKVEHIKEKLRELRERVGDYREEAGKLVREKVQELLARLRTLGDAGKRSFLKLMDYVARLKFSDYVRYLHEKLLSHETLSKVRDYLRNLVTESKALQHIKQLVSYLPLDRLRELLGHFLPSVNRHEARSIADMWERVKNFFKELGIVEKVKDHFNKLGEFLLEHYNKGIATLKEKYGSIKALALEAIANVKDMSAETAQEALEFFGQYKEQLGDLYDHLKEVLKGAIGDLKNHKNDE